MIIVRLLRDKAMSRRLYATALLAIGPTLLGGCVANMVADVVTAPVKIVSGGVDLMTTSQSESDEKRGRSMRHREERLGKLSRTRDEYGAKCRKKGKEDDCRRAAEADAEIRELLNDPY